LEDLRERDSWKDTHVDGRIILQSILKGKEQDGVDWNPVP
jgi:hypothetical protein